jgi:hypothetical protein
LDTDDGTGQKLDKFSQGFEGQRKGTVSCDERSGQPVTWKTLDIWTARPDIGTMRLRQAD